MNFWCGFYDKPFIFQEDGLHLSEVGAAQLGRLLSNKVSSFRPKKHPARTCTLIYVEDCLTRNKFKIFYVNARTLHNKSSELEELVFTENCNIIGLTESRLNLQNRDLFSTEYKIISYRTFGKSRVNKNGAGVILYIKPSLNPITLSKPIITNVYALFISLKKYSRKKTSIISYV